ncbi:uncharacterized protein LOC130443128 [Diorhabda sublineata]|uniref:uncharacterized protein LOC130443128 n=1 Tax=Diorhabda sublineata TaxID=1163346 RepID=UPI0024E129BD|nr:uncharacterized protein LOC130443128 [Diorhabda sublineata]
MKKILPRPPELKIPPIPNNFDNNGRRCSSLPDDKMDFPIKKDINFLPLPINDKKNKSLNDLNINNNDRIYTEEIRTNSKRNRGYDAIINKSSSESLKGMEYPGKYIDSFHQRTNVNKSPEQIPQTHGKFTRDLPKFDNRSNFSSDEEEFVSYFSKKNIADYSNPVYGNLETATFTLKTKMKRNIPPSSSPKKINLKLGYGIENGAYTLKQIAKSNPNIFREELQSKLEQGYEIGMRESYHYDELEELYDDTVYTNEPIYENIDEIFIKDKNLDDLIVRHGDEMMFNGNEYEETYTYQLSTFDNSDSSPTYSNQYELVESQTKTHFFDNIINTDDHAIYENIRMLKRTEKDTKDEIIMNINYERFFRNTDRKGAKLILRNLPDRAFLFRPSHRFFLVLTIKYHNNIINLGINQTPDKKLSLDTETGDFPMKFDSLTDMVSYFTDEEITFMTDGEYLQMRLNPVLPPDLF